MEMKLVYLDLDHDRRETRFIIAGSVTVVTNPEFNLT